MAKADFCFNFYDGDATRDMAHMDRLARGAYMDVVIQQRQRGPLSLDDLRAFLSKDFEAVWPALQWALKKDDSGKFYIEWLRNSELRAKKHSTKQRENVLNRYQDDTKTLPKTSLVTPLGDGHGDGNGSVSERKEGQEETKLDLTPTLDAALVDLYLEPLLMNGKNLYPGVDIPLEVERFRQKVLGSPRVYRDHEVEGLRNAFSFQLRAACRPTVPVGKAPRQKAFNLKDELV